MNNPRTTITSAARAAARVSARGFSLLEIMLVIVIIGLIVGVAAVNLLGTAERAKIKTTKASMANIKASITSYMTENSSVPDSLQTLVDAKFLQGVGSTNHPPKDSWDVDFYYKPGTDAAGNPYTLLSTGADKQPNTPDDINVWTMDD